MKLLRHTTSTRFALTFTCKQIYIASILAGLCVTNVIQLPAYNDFNFFSQTMKGYTGNIETLTINNNDFRHVLYTGHNAQLVLMSLNPGEEIGMEVHSENDQFFRFEQGEGRCVIDGNEYSVSDGSAIIVPAGAKHNIINTSKEIQLKMYTIYSPAHHKDGIIHKTKEEAESNEEDFDGITTE